MNLSLETLKTASSEAVELWQALELATDDKEIDAIWESIWNNQSTQQETTDWVADLVDQIDADIIAIKSRKKCVDELHDQAIASRSSEFGVRSSELKSSSSQ